MKEQIKQSRIKTNAYNDQDMTDYINKEEYKGESFILRKLNPKTEQYEYETIERNLKLEWENVEQTLNLGKSEINE